MDPGAERLIRSRDVRRQEQAETAAQNLESILLMCDGPWFDPGVLRLHRRHAADVLRHLGEHQGLAKAVNELLYLLASSVSGPADLDDPTLLLNTATFLSLLAENYAPALGADCGECRQHLDALTQRVVADLVKVARPQCERLGDVVDAVRQFVRTHPPSSGRVILPEFPIGNTIPVRLIAEQLRGAGYRVETPRFALARSDTSGSTPLVGGMVTAGMTGLGLTSGDLVVYVDEWVTGTNFQTISTALADAARRAGAPLLPAGLLTDTSHAEKGYAKRQAAHDALAGRAGVAGGDFRFVFPGLATRFPRARGHYFFWSEHDRTAGYRKAQPLGMMVSSVAAAVETLADDDDALRAAWLRLTEDRAEMIPGAFARVIDLGTTAGVAAARSAFTASREAFRQSLPEIEAIDHPSNRGEVDDPAGLLQDICRAIVTVADRHGAALCVSLAVSHLRGRPGVDPEDRYHFRNHAPVIVELGEHAQGYHRALMYALRAIVERPAGGAGS